MRACARVVRGPVVDEDEFVRGGTATQPIANFRQDQGNVLALVVCEDEQRKRDGHGDREAGPTYSESRATCSDCGLLSPRRTNWIRWERYPSRETVKVGFSPSREMGSPALAGSPFDLEDRIGGGRVDNDGVSR